MKLYQIILLVMAAAVCEVKAECQCGIFTMDTNEANKNEIHLSSTFPQSCDRLEVDQLCRDFCYQKFLNMTANGDLAAVSPVFNVSSGDFFCDALKKEMTNEVLAGFYRWCQTSWKYVGIRANEKFCCRPLGTFVRCDEIREERLDEFATTIKISRSEIQEEDRLTPANLNEAAPSAAENATENVRRERRDLPRSNETETDSAAKEIVVDVTTALPRKFAFDEEQKINETATTEKRIERRSVTDAVKEENKTEAELQRDGETRPAEEIIGLKATESPLLTLVSETPLAPALTGKPLTRRGAPLEDNVLLMVTQGQSHLSTVPPIPTTAAPKPLEVTAEFADKKAAEPIAKQEVIDGREPQLSGLISTTIRPHEIPLDTTLARE